VYGGATCWGGLLVQQVTGVIVPFVRKVAVINRGAASSKARPLPAFRMTAEIATV